MTNSGGLRADFGRLIDSADEAALRRSLHRRLDFHRRQLTLDPRSAAR